MFGCWLGGLFDMSGRRERSHLLRRASGAGLLAGLLAGRAHMMGGMICCMTLQQSSTGGARDVRIPNVALVHMLLLAGDVLINCTPVHEALGDSIAEALPVSVAVSTLPDIVLLCWTHWTTCAC